MAKKMKLFSESDCEMEENSMFHFQDDNPDKMMQGCLTRKTLKDHNATKYLQILITKEGNKYRHKVIDNKGKTHFEEISKEDFVHINVRSLLEKYILGKEKKK